MITCLYADDLTNGGLHGEELALTIPPGLIHLGSSDLHGGLNIGIPQEIIIGYPEPVWEPADLIQLTFMDITGQPDQLIEIGPVCHRAG